MGGLRSVLVVGSVCITWKRETRALWEGVVSGGNPGETGRPGNATVQDLPANERFSEAVLRVLRAPLIEDIM